MRKGSLAGATVRWPITISVDWPAWGRFDCTFSEDGDCSVSNFYAGERVFEGTRRPIRPSISRAVRLSGKVMAELDGGLAR